MSVETNKSRFETARASFNATMSNSSRIIAANSSLRERRDYIRKLITECLDGNGDFDPETHRDQTMTLKREVAQLKGDCPGAKKYLANKRRLKKPGAASAHC